MDVEKPEGYDLRVRRSNKTMNGKDWLPCDAIYDASKEAADNTDAVLILWRTPLPDGGWYLRWRFAGPSDSSAALLTQALRQLT